MPNIYVVREHIPAAEIRRPQPSVEVPPEPPWRPDGWLSIRETIDTAAKALFRGEWTGNEVYARALPPLSGKTEDDLEKCQQHRRGRFNLLNHPVDGRGETDPATIEEYAAECAAARRHFETITWLRQRWWSGDIPVSRLDGKMHPVLQHQFADGNFFYWVVRHAGNPLGVGGHLFVRKSDLARALEAEDRQPAACTAETPALPEPADAPEDDPGSVVSGGGLEYGGVEIEVVEPTRQQIAPDAAPDAASVSTPIEQHKTGLPGRPTIAHLVLEEFRCRVKSGQCKDTLAAEARALHDWAATKHKMAPTPKARSIENQIRAEYRTCIK